MMTRRTIGLPIIFALAILLAPLAARSQSPARLPTIGFLGATTPAAQRPLIAAFVQRLHDLGWIDGRTLVIEYRWAEGRPARVAEIAAEFVRRQVDVMITHGTAPVVAAQQTTSVIPIVSTGMVDPVGTGLVASRARPGGNVTGLSVQSSDLAGKRLDLLRKVIPKLHRLAILANVGHPPSLLEVREVQTTARTLGLDVAISSIRQAQEIAPAFDVLKGRGEALYIPPDSLINTHRKRITTLALSAGLPTISGFREYAVAGGLLSYGPNCADLYRRAADYVDKILKGAKPADLPIEQPTTFELVINLKTAQALGITIPPTLLFQADEVIR
jgi:putative tryptophan/tyrosine transport system substrate-binding protein